MRRLLGLLPEEKKAKFDRNTAAMISLPIPPEIVEQLVPLTKKLKAPSAPDHFHCTMVFIPDKSIYGEDVRRQIEWEAERVAKKHLPMKAGLNGFTVFNHLNEDEGGYPYVLLLNVPRMNLLQADLTRMMESFGQAPRSDFGYIPHLTLGYDPGKAKMPGPGELPDLNWPVNEVGVYWGWNEASKIISVPEALVA